MFGYFARLHEKYDLPVYPIVIFSYDAPARPEPHRYKVAFPDKTVLQFDYRVIQLNRLSWRRFVKQANPEATMEMVSSWERKGRQEGRLEGMEHVVLRLLRRHLGDLPAEVERRIEGLSLEQIDLTDTLLDIQSVEQVAAWLSRQTSQ